MHADRTVRPRWIWSGLTTSLAGAGLVGLGIIVWDLVPLVAGTVLLAAGVAAAAHGGVLYDTHSARPLRAELAEVRRGDVHEGTAPGDMVADPQVRRDAHKTSRTVSGIAAARANAPRPGLVRACAVLLLLAAGLVLAAQGLYPHTPRGQDNATRDLGIAILTALAGLRLLVGYRPGRIWSLLAVCSGLGLLACAVLTQHDSTDGRFVETVAGAWVVAAAALSLHRTAQTGNAPGGGLT